MRRFRLTNIRLLVCGLLTIGAISEAATAPLLQSKPIEFHLVFADVWPGGYSEVWLLEGGKPFRFVTNIDFRVFDPTLLLETSDAIHDFLILSTTYSAADVVYEQSVGVADGRGYPTYWPQQLPATNGGWAFVALPRQNNGSTSVIASMLHQYYGANRDAIVAQAFRRQAAQDAAASLPLVTVTPTPHVGPAVYFKRIEYPTPAPSPR